METTKITKIVNKECQDCGKKISVLCNESALIVSARCPNCVRKFELRNKKYELIKKR